MLAVVVKNNEMVTTKNISTAIGRFNAYGCVRIQECGKSQKQDMNILRVLSYLPQYINPTENYKSFPFTWV
jgi:hypothetical protein